MEGVSFVQSPYKFAKYNGLVEDHQSLDFALLPATPAPDILTAWCETDYAIIASVDAILARHAQWKIDAETRGLLDSILMSEPDGDQYVAPVTFAYLSLKLDLPFLQMDHDVCMQKLQSRNAQIVTVKEARAALHDLAQKYQLDTCLEHGTSPTDDLTIHEERLSITRDVVDYLGELLLVDQDLDVSSGSSHPGDLIALPLKVDNVLLSNIPTPSLGPYSIKELVGSDLVPSEVPSDDIWTTELEVEVLDMFDRSFESASSSVLQPLYPSEASSAHHLSDAGLTKPAYVSMQQLRLTSPILPGTTPDESLQANELQEMAALVPKQSDVVDETYDDDEAQLLTRICSPAVAATNHLLENECLIEIDTTLKFPLPALKADARGASFEQIDPTTGLLETARSLIAPQERQCKGLSRIEKRLSWVPFASTDAVVDVSQPLPCVAELDLGSYLYEDDSDGQVHNVDVDVLAGIEIADTLAPVIDSSHRQSSEGRDSPRTVCLPSSNSSMLIAGDVKEADPYGEQKPVLRSADCLQDLLRKRKHELEEGAGLPSVKRLLHDLWKIDEAGPETLGGRMSRYLSAIGRPQPDTSASVRQVEAANHMQTVTAEAAMKSTLTVPKLQGDQVDAQIIVSPELISNQALISRIRVLMPELELIERAATHHEADITLSPSHGLILITMQKLKQKALPGQKNNTSLWARLQEISLAYQQVDVLVSEGGANNVSSEAQFLAEQDCHVISELVALCSQLNGLIRVMYIPGNDSELSTWICATISKAQCNASFQLVQDETLWEHFLRMAGFNAFAAQALLASLRSADQYQADNGMASLAHLATLAVEARSSLLRPLLGQDGISRFNSVFDSVWFADRTT